MTRMTKIPYINQEGVCLCKYGDPGLGELVRQGKYSAEKRFCDERGGAGSGGGPGSGQGEGDSPYGVRQE